MRPIQYPTCQFKWNVREDSPRELTCPLCLALAKNPDPPAATIALAPPPLALRSLEREVSHDQTGGNAGLFIAILLISIGVIVAILKTPTRLDVSIAIALAATVAVTIVLAFASALSQPSYAIGISAGVVLSTCLAIFHILVSIAISISSACSQMYKGL
jgi:hypothetical protein